jgi:hypothetical protein
MFDVSQTMAISKGAAFDAMADARNEVNWNSKVTRSVLIGGEPVQQGTRFQTINRGQTYDAVITEYERPSRLTFAVTGKQMDITTRFTFSETTEGTALRGEFDFRPKGFLKVMFPLMRPMIRGDLPKQMASFAKFLTKG